MPKLSKAEKRRRLANDLAYRVGGLSALGVFMFVALQLNDANGLVVAGIAAAVAMFAVGLPASVLLRRLLVPRIETNLEFDDVPIPKNRRASEFEYEVAALIQQLTGKRTQVVGGSGDGGIDIKVWDEAKLVGIVQCKCLASNKFVYPAHIRDLNTVRHYHHVNTAYLVSTGRFSDASGQSS